MNKNDDDLRKCQCCNFLIDYSHIYLEKDGFQLVLCKNCGLVKRKVMPTEEDLQVIYANDYFRSDEGETKGQGYQDYLAEEPQHRINARKRLDLLSDFSRHVGGKLLDVGCASGFFIDEAAKREWDPSGIDIAPSVTQYAQQNLKRDVRTGNFVSSEFGYNSFSCVTMWDYIEHSATPREDIARAAKILKPGGLLAISTGDISSLAARISKSRWHLLTPRHHNFFFTKRSLIELLNQSGFDIQLIKHPSHWYSCRYLVYKLQTASNKKKVLKTFDSLSKRIPENYAVPVNLFDIMTVIARKKALSS